VVKRIHFRESGKIEDGKKDTEWIDVVVPYREKGLLSLIGNLQVAYG
jgi:hypothetical protein